MHILSFSDFLKEEGIHLFDLNSAFVPMAQKFPVDGEREDYEEDGEVYPKDIYQFYGISPDAYDILKEKTELPLFYFPDLDLYVVGITFFGTPWFGIYDY